MGLRTVRHKGLRRTLRLPLLLLAALAANEAAAEEFATPTLTALRLDWRAALDQFRAELAPYPALADEFSFSDQQWVLKADGRRIPALVRLNAITSRSFPGIQQSPVPVLLPFDTGRLLAPEPAQTQETTPSAATAAGFQAAMFDAGPAGYDAVLTLDANSGDGLPPRVYAGDHPLSVCNLAGNAQGHLRMGKRRTDLPKGEQGMSQGSFGEGLP